MGKISSLGNGIMAPMNTLPKTVLSSPSQSEAQGSSLNSNLNNTCSTVLSRLKFEEAIEKNIVQIEKEAHLKRLKNLRKELDYLQNTAWKYPSIDHYIGQ
uniref:Uncharacterized protein n=1 Tax=Cuerna arida TaxID=1464854 RepID=A0A1B6GHA1_9HEMI